jgi:hypothetical protein
MPKRSRKTTDPDTFAASIVQEATSAAPREKNPAAVALGRLGGLKGGKARAEKLSRSRRQAIARKAAKSRWARKA